MDRQSRSNLAIGLILVLVGGWFLAVQFVPGLARWINLEYSWPLIIVGVGALLLMIGVLTGVPGMAVPAAILSGIGAILYWQNATGRWESWAYVWTLIPGFAGVGILLSGLLGDQPRKNIREGAGLVATSAVLFLIFSAFFGIWGGLGRFWPVLLIGLGIWILFRSLVWRRAE